MARTSKKPTATNNRKALGGVEALGRELVEAAQARAKRLQDAAERYAQGAQLRHEAERLNAQADEVEDEALTALAAELDSSEVGKALGISARRVSTAVKRHQAKQSTEQSTGGGSEAEVADIREPASAATA